MKIKEIFFLAVALAVSQQSFSQDKKWSLEECIEYAMKKNISIQLSILDEKLAKVDKKDAFGAFLPTANAQASHSWNVGLNQNITTGLLENQTTQFTSAGVNVGIDIYNGMQNYHRARRANLAIIAAQYRLTKMREDIALNVANAYLQILFNKENLKVQQQQLEIDKQQQARVQDLVDAGSVPAGDLLDVKATVATDLQKAIQAENALLISKLSLAQLMQLDNFQEFDTEDSDYPMDTTGIMDQSPAAVYEKARNERTEVKIAKADVEVAERDIRLARGAFQPRLQGFYSFTTRAAYADRVLDYQQSTAVPFRPIGAVGSTGELVFTENYVPILGRPESVWKQFDDNKGHSFGLSLNIPILNGLSARNNVERRLIALDRSKITLKQEEVNLETNVYTAYTDAQGAQKAYEAAIAMSDAREGALNYARERYEVGLINIFDLNQAQTLSVNAKSEVLRTKYDYIFRMKILEFYFGVPIYQKQ